MTPFSMLRCCASVAPQAQHLKPMLQRTYVKCCAVALRSCAYRSERSATLNPRCAFTCSYTCTPKAQQRNILRKPLSLLIPRVALWVSKAQQKRNMNPKCCNGRWLSGNGQRNKRNVCRKYRFGLNLEVHQ